MSGFAYLDNYVSLIKHYYSLIKFNLGFLLFRYLGFAYKTVLVSLIKFNFGFRLLRY